VTVLVKWLCPNCGRALAVYLEERGSEKVRCPVCGRLYCYERTSRRIDTLKIYRGTA
jgi:ribosomal protein S27E